MLSPLHSLGLQLFAAVLFLSDSVHAVVNPDQLFELPRQRTDHVYNGPLMGDCQNRPVAQAMTEALIMATAAIGSLNRLLNAPNSGLAGSDLVRLALTAKMLWGVNPKINKAAQSLSQWDFEDQVILDGAQENYEKVSRYLLGTTNAHAMFACDDVNLPVSTERQYNTTWPPAPAPDRALCERFGDDPAQYPVYISQPAFGTQLSRWNTQLYFDSPTVATREYTGRSCGGYNADTTPTTALGHTSRRMRDDPQAANTPYTLIVICKQTWDRLTYTMQDYFQGNVPSAQQIKVSRWFNLDISTELSGFDTVSETVLHEMMHFVNTAVIDKRVTGQNAGGQYTNEPAYGVWRCWLLAQNRKLETVANADTYVLFAKAVYLNKWDWSTGEAMPL